MYNHNNATATANPAQKSNLIEAFALWAKTSQKGVTYYTGDYQGNPLVAFVEKKKSLKDPEIVIYQGNGQDKTVFAKLWANVSKSGNKYLSCKNTDGTRLVGFFNPHAKENPRQPAIRFYISAKEGN